MTGSHLPELPEDLASVDLVLATTRSVRRKLDFERAVEPELVHECIDIATQAPTGIPGENWRFLLVWDKDQKARLAKLYESTLLAFVETRGLPFKDTQRALISKLADMPLLICVCALGRHPGEDCGEQVGFYGSILPAAWSLMLSLRARGLGSTWTSLLASRQAQVREILDMPEDATLTVMLPVAYMKGARLAKADRRGAREVSYSDWWGR